MSAKRTVTIFRSSVPTSGPTEAPQFGQKRAPSGSGRPHTEQVMTTKQNMLTAMADSKTEALSRVPLFSQLSKHELEFVASRADEVGAKAGKTLTTQGRPGDSFYILLDGEADVEVDGKPRRHLEGGGLLRRDQHAGSRPGQRDGDGED